MPRKQTTLCLSPCDDLAEYTSSTSSASYKPPEVAPVVPPPAPGYLLLPVTKPIQPQLVAAFGTQNRSDVKLLSFTTLSQPTKIVAALLVPDKPPAAAPTVDASTPATRPKQCSCAKGRPPREQT